MTSGTHNFGILDRCIHRLAFNSEKLQLHVAEMEEAMYASRLAPIDTRAPVFITSLPRGGTTLLLDLLCNSGEFASHSYLDMPFVLCPMLWDLLTRRGRGAPQAQERAHGDGMFIDHESVESFEEVVWRANWPEHYRGDRSPLWNDMDLVAPVRRALSANMKKIIALRRAQRPSATRYVSKNNANLARLGLLAAAFPEASIIVPFREPAGQVASLMRQHQLFLELQRKDAFARDYMGYVGHREFGVLFAPICFPGLAPVDPGIEAPGTGFWFDYWGAAFEYVLSQATPNVHLLDYDELCRAPERSLAQLAQRVGMARSERLLGLIGSIRAPVDSSGETELKSKVAHGKCEGILRRLRARSINGPAESA